tara:strand:- start:4256 stop:4420 length:165 start_codon:yes stop_codon:yes gene_type:complete
MGALQSKTVEKKDDGPIDYGMEKKDLEDLLDDQKLVEEEPIFKKIDHHTKVTEL